MDKGWAGITGEEGKDADAMASDWEAGLKNAGIDRSWVPVFAADDYSPERLAERYMVRYVTSLYCTMLYTIFSSSLSSSTSLFSPCPCPFHHPA